MMTKTVFLFCVSVLLLQSVYGQCSRVSSNLGLGNVGNVLTPASNLAIQGLGCSNNLGLASFGQATNVLGTSSNGLNLATCNTGIRALPDTTFTILGGSPSCEDGSFSVVSDNLEIGGNVYVSGAIPFFATIAVDGSVPSEGKATVDYSAGPLSFGPSGCGQGLASNVGITSGIGLAPGISTIGSNLNCGTNIAATGLNGFSLGNVGLAGGLTGPKSCGLDTKIILNPF